MGRALSHLILALSSPTFPQLPNPSRAGVPSLPPRVYHVPPRFCDSIAGFTTQLPNMGPCTSSARTLATLLALFSCVSLSRAFVSGRAAATTTTTATNGCRHTAVRGRPLCRVSSRPPAPVAGLPPRAPPELRSTGGDSEGGDGDDGIFGGEENLTFYIYIPKTRCNQTTCVRYR